MEIPVFDLVALGNILLTAFVTGVVVFGLQQLIEDRKNRNFERFKTSHQKRIGLTEDFSKQLTQVQICLGRIEAYWPSEDISPSHALENSKELNEAFRSYRRFVYENEFYWPQDLYILLNKQCSLLYGITLATNALNVPDTEGDTLSPEGVEASKSYANEHIDQFFQISTSIKRKMHKWFDSGL